MGWGLASLLLLFLFLVVLPPLAGIGSLFVPLALSLGYASHLAADACTKSGIPLFYPRRKRYHLLPRALRLTTGSLAEEAVFMALAMMVLLLMLGQLYQQATRFGF